MKALAEFLPVIFFFVAYKNYDIFVATGVLIAATAVQMIFQKVKGHEISKMQLISLVLIVVLGGVTIALKDEKYLKWKVSVVNWGFGLAFLASHYIGRTTFIEKVFTAQKLSIPSTVLRKLNFSWALFFVFLGMLNLYVMMFFDTDFWVNFKLFGLFGLTLLFTIGQAFTLRKYL